MFGIVRVLQAFFLFALVTMSLSLIGCGGGGGSAPDIDPSNVIVQGNPGKIDPGSFDLGGTAIKSEGTGGSGQIPGGIPSDEATLLEAWKGEYGNFSTAKQGGEKGDPIPDFNP